MNIKMLNGNLLVSLEVVENQTSGGIILPSSVQSSFNVAKVVAPDVENSVKVGDSIYIPKYAGTEITLDGELYFIINVREIILVL